MESEVIELGQPCGGRRLKAVQSSWLQRNKKDGEKTAARQKAAAQSTAISWRHSLLGLFQVLERHGVLSGALHHG